MAEKNIENCILVEIFHKGCFKPRVIVPLHVELFVNVAIAEFNIYHIYEYNIGPTRNT